LLLASRFFLVRAPGTPPSPDPLSLHDALPILICGFFSCDVRPFNPLLESLPRFMRLGRGASNAPGGLLDQFIRFATAETGNKRADRQSTRLNSSHVKISYAAFCLKKKTQ